MKKFQCDNCKEMFDENQVVVKSLPENFHISVPFSVVFEKDGIQYAPFCPKCDSIHVLGFDVIEIRNTIHESHKTSTILFRMQKEPK